jgi:hypothetical protein
MHDEIKLKCQKEREIDMVHEGISEMRSDIKAILKTTSVLATKIEERSRFNAAFVGALGGMLPAIVVGIMVKLLLEK